MSEENNALAIRQNDNFLAPVADLQTILYAYQVKKEFIEQALKPNLDFGTIPGSTKPTLLKPGAEKLANIYGFAPVFEDVVTIEDWSGENHGGEPFFYYRQKCKLYRGDRLIGSADGSCNSWEKKYRYRNGQRVCPKCGQPTIFQSKPPKTGFYCWSKKGGCGAQYAANDASITSQEIGQVANPDICDVINTVLKMAQKRALVAAILITTGASDYFTQDVEDFIDPAQVWEPQTQAQEAAFRPEPPQLPEEPNPFVEPPSAQVVPPPANGNGKAKLARPYTAETVKAGIDKKAQSYQGRAASNEQRGLLVGVMEKCYAGDGAKDKRHAAFRYLTGSPSVQTMPDNFVIAMLDWLKPNKDSGGDYLPDPMAKKEAQSVLTVSMQADGQQSLL